MFEIKPRENQAKPNKSTQAANKQTKKAKKNYQKRYKNTLVLKGAGCTVPVSWGFSVFVVAVVGPSVFDQSWTANFGRDSTWNNVAYENDYENLLGQDNFKIQQ